ncbi:hypothetical protein EFV37_29295 [Mesorhizobium loti]|uniref:Uncharacterized protein n=1 Tax=Mesorhizobium jarvisii TaxID=1777867 RepID=A0A6M7TM35_9HYPH|nr:MULTISPECIES: hypothetical protein [Mesorhizobium]OBQ68935.1 hypothetical protein A9K72_12150 [Mesorhizobium loti]QKC65899.1 hypothetical protein EB229_29285 [Mesorhizobium jarvisii]QKD11813.1 hypothetical protein EFV37_29295 [Mesorhizobium loti]RJT37920.1 hypothetical protein D3242_01340 [Mesorhizobium jarvisii]
MGGDLPLKDTFIRFTDVEVDVTIWGQTFKAKIGLIGDGYDTPIEAGIIVLRVTSDVRQAVAEVANRKS